MPSATRRLALAVAAARAPGITPVILAVGHGAYTVLYAAACVMGLLNALIILPGLNVR